MDTRLTRLRSAMSEQKLDAVLVSSVPNIIYITEYNGFSPLEREAYLIVTKKKAFLVVTALHIEEAKTQAKNVEVIERTTSNPLKEIIKDLTKKHTVSLCGFEGESLTFAEYKFFSKHFSKVLPADLSYLRIIKSKSEISSVKKACGVGDNAYSHILKNLRIGMTEKDIALEIELFIRKSGYDISFPPVVAFEDYAAIPHHNTGDRKLKHNNTILLDFGAKVDNYCSDMTRTFCFGKATPEQKKVHQTVFTAQKKSIKYIEDKLAGNEKVIATSIDGIARDYVVGQGYPPFNHSSHGIGLEVHEQPHITRSKDPVENGMVFSIEPGIYLSGKFGVRIEDLFAIENNKLIPLTHSPKELLEIY